MMSWRNTEKWWDKRWPHSGKFSGRINSHESIGHFHISKHSFTHSLKDVDSSVRAMVEGNIPELHPSITAFNESNLKLGSVLWLIPQSWYDRM